MSDEIVTTADAGAVTPESQPAAAGGAPEVTPSVTPDAGAVTPETPAAESEGVSDQTTPSQEGVKTPTEGHQKTLEQRVQELAEKRIAEVEQRLTAKLQEVSQEPAKLDFIPDLDFSKINEFLRSAMDEIEQAQLDGDFLKAMELQDRLSEMRGAIKTNEQKKAEYMKQQESQQLTQQQTAMINERIAEASNLVAKEHNIPAEVWKAGEEFFINERRNKPLIDAQYREKVMLQGPVAALLWAKEYVEKNMGKKESELINQKEAAKESLPAGKTSGGVVPDAGAARLAALKKAASSGNPSDLAAYSQAKREASQ